MTYHFLNMLLHLHQQEEVLLYSNILDISLDEQQAVIQYLKEYYAQESLDYPYIAPSFNGDAALWAAHTLYMANQLLLFRENKQEDLAKMLPFYVYEITPSAIASADLTLRFLPDVIKKLADIDPEDPLIPILEGHLHVWHYSSVNYELETDLAFSTIQKNDCLMQLYSNRIIQYQRKDLAFHEVFHAQIIASLGMHAGHFWKDFELETIHTNS